MSPISLRVLSAVLGVAAFAAASPAAAGAFYTGASMPAISVGGNVSIPHVRVPGGDWGHGGDGGCGHGGGGGSTIIINKNINLNKNINVNKVVVINKINVQVEAFAQAMAQANANAGARVIVYGGGSYEYVKVNNYSSIGAIATAGHCEMQDATVVKSIHAICISADGHEFPATHMTDATWVNSAYEGEVARCIAGAHLKITIGDVVQSDQGMAGTYTSGVILQCGEHEAVRHFKDGLLKCAPAMEVADCTERSNLRKYGTGDLFFTYRSRVCAESVRSAERDVQLDGAVLSGGVGDGGY